MTAREEILQAVRAALPAPAPLPDADALTRGFAPTGADLVRGFVAAARAAGADVLEGRRGELDRLIAEAYPEARAVVSAAAGIVGSTPLVDAPRELAGIDLLVCDAVFGVAENGAAWIPASRPSLRAALFLAPHLAVVLARDAIAADLHEAYARLELTTECFGAFVAGPSKTADIEQSLVIGAQGPTSLTLILVDTGPARALSPGGGAVSGGVRPGAAP